MVDCGTARPKPSPFIFEEWESEEALQRHFQTEHMKTFQQQAPKLLAGKVNAKKYTIESAASL